MSAEAKTYLGDGVYASCDGYHIRLTTENGIETTNEIFLEPAVARKLLEYYDRLIQAAKEQKGD
jgi:hypothetical protein